MTSIAPVAGALRAVGCVMVGWIATTDPMNETAVRLLNIVINMIFLHNTSRILVRIRKTGFRYQLIHVEYKFNDFFLII